MGSVAIIAQYRTEEILNAIAASRGMDYTDPRLYKAVCCAKTSRPIFGLSRAVQLDNRLSQ